MNTNTKIRTEDVLECLDVKIKTSSAHQRLGVLAAENYDSVLSKIAARSPTLDQKHALENAENPSAANPLITVSNANESISSKIPWRTIGPAGSGAEFSGNDETPFVSAFASGANWIYVRAGTYTFSTTVNVPQNVTLVGASSASTILTSLGTTLLVGNNVYLGFLQIVGVTALTAAGNGVTLQNCILSAQTTTLSASSVSLLKIFDVAFLTGTLSATSISNSMFSGLYFNTTAPSAVFTSPSNISLVGSIFVDGSGGLQLTNGVNVRIVANHLGGGVVNTTPTSVLLRANTPNSNNNDSDDFIDLLKYVGSPSLTEEFPSYASNYAGSQGEDLTARASGLDLLIQWRYEERNFHLVADNATNVVWSPATNSLSTTGMLSLVSAHRRAPWILPRLSSTVIPSNYFMYYVLDRTLDSTPISLQYQLAALGSIPNDVTAPNSADNRQIYVLAFNLNGTLWWRGGNGSRFPSTGGQTGTYFVDGKSKSLITYLGASDYNDEDPNYSNNFAGIQGEGLTTRLGKSDTLLRRLFEFSNLAYYLGTGAYFSAEAGALTLNGTLYFTLPHVTGRLVVNAAAWAPPDGSLIYLTWDQGALAGSDQVVTATIATTVPLPDAYPLTLKYFVFAIRKGSDIILWNGERIPLFGGRWPLVNLQTEIIPINTPTILDENIVWTGTDLLWESLALILTNGIPLQRLRNQTTASAGLTDLNDGECLTITFSCNDGAVPHYVTVQKTVLPVFLAQNQILWATKNNGIVVLD